MGDNMKNTKTISICACMLLLFVTASAVTGTKLQNKDTTAYQPPIQWSKTYGGDMIDWGDCIQQTSDGGYIISGTYGRNAWSLWFSYYYLVKIDASGNEEWNQVYGPYDAEYVAKSIQQTPDGGYIIAGYKGVTYMYDAVVQKTDSLGNLIWEKTFGDQYAYDTGLCVALTSDGGYIITGITSSYGAEAGDALLVKLDSDGNEDWITTLGGADSDSGYSVQQTPDGGYIIAGDSSSYSSSGDAYLVKTDANGNEEWHNVFGGDQWDGAYSVDQTTDGGYILSGYYGYEDWTNDVYLIKTDASGNEEWSTCFGDIDYDEGFCVKQVSDGGYFITGYSTDPINYDPDLYVIKTDAMGAEEWSQCIDGTDTEEYGNYGIETTDGGYIVTGYTGFYMEQTLDMLVIKFQGTNQPPNQPENPSPADGSVDVDVQTDLSWTCSDPDGDAVTYDVYFGTTSEPVLVAEDLTDPSYDPGTLLENTTYYWKVIAQDSYAAFTEGPVWSFTTQQEEQVQLEISDVNGGMGISAVVSNIGTIPAEHVEWTIEVHGGLFGRIATTTSGSIDQLSTGEQETISTGMFFGLGNIQVTITAGDLSVTEEGIQFLFFTLLA